MVYLWVLSILSLLAAAAVAWVALRRHSAERKATQATRTRFAIRDSAERIPLAPDRPAQPPALAPTEILPIGGMGSPIREGAAVAGRLVNTPDGEMILTTPPFALREAIFRKRIGRFVNMLARRIPPWMMLCPRVRLDTLIVPTPPDGRDAADWREWRKRIRVRSLDLVLCDRRDWRPIVCVVFETASADARTFAGGQDRIIDEVLAHVGLPLLRLSGDFTKDWPLIQPYIDQGILRHISDEEALEGVMRPEPVDTDSAVTLLRMDQDKGWVLE